MTSYALLFTLSIIGVAETSYLVRKRIALEKPVCLIGKNCTLVLESKYNKLFIVPNDVLGTLFYVAISFITAFLVIGVEPTAFWESILNWSVAIASALSLFFTYLQWRVIQAWCFWCLISAFTIWFMAIILLFK